MFIRIIFMSFASGFLAGCAGMPNPKYDANSPDGIECTYEAKKGAAAVNVPGRSGLNLEQMFKENELFNLCMQVKEARSGGGSGGSNITVVARTLQDTFTQIRAEVEESCKNPDFKEYYEKTACTSDRITLTQMADTSKITQNQRPVLLVAREVADSKNKKFIDAIRKSGQPLGSKVADYLEGQSFKNERLAMELYDGEITWGQYNRRRKEIAQQNQDGIKNIR
jgi:hypothetical protein